MKAYLCCVDPSGLRWFVREDVLPKDLRRELVRGWSSMTTIVLWAAVADEDAEAIRGELLARLPVAACELLSDRAVELLPSADAAPDSLMPAFRVPAPEDPGLPTLPTSAAH